MQDRKEYILRKAFEVFIDKGYDSASMTILQQQLDMSRGAMYRYFDSKDDLFIAVIDKYVFGTMDYVKLVLDEEMTIPERIDKHCNQIQIMYQRMVKVDNIQVRFLNFSALLIQAAKIYPGFLERVNLYRNAQQKGWEKSIEIGIEKGEIRPEINVKLVANLFQKAIGLREKLDESFEKLDSGDEATREAMNYIYSLIKT
jgi:AcrR family transcriptional regulator